MVDVMKKLGNMISTVVPLDHVASDSGATSTSSSSEDSKPLPPLPNSNQSESNEESVETITYSTEIAEGVGHAPCDDAAIVIERQMQFPSSLVDKADVVFPPLADDIRKVLGATDASNVDSTATSTENLEGAGHVSHDDVTLVIERQMQVPSSLVDNVDAVFPPLTDDIEDILGANHASEVASNGDGRQRHGSRLFKSHSPERYTDLPVDLTPEMKSLHQSMTDEVRDFGGGYYLHPKKIVEIPPELSHQTRTLHEELNKEVVHGADLLHPKEIVEIPPEVSQDVRHLHEELKREVEHGADVLHPKEIAEIPAELSPEIRNLHEELNSEFKCGADVLHPKEIVEIPAELSHEVQELHGALNEEVKQFGDFNHLHPKQIVEIPAELSKEVEKLHEALNEEVIQVGGPEQLRPKPIVEIPAELNPEVRDLVSDLNQEVAYVGGQHILHPKTIAEVPADLCEEARYLHEDLNQEVKLVGPNLLHPKQIAEIPPELSPKVREAHKGLNDEVRFGAYPLHPKEVIEIPPEVKQETRDLHGTLAVEVELFGGADRLHEKAGAERSLEPPAELSESVKELLPTLTTEIKQFDGPSKLRYGSNPKMSGEHHGVAPKLDIDSFQTHVEQMLHLYGAADSALDLSTSNKTASGNLVMDECISSVVNAFIDAARKLREPAADKDVLVEELQRRRSVIDVDDSAPAKQSEDHLSKDDNRKPVADNEHDHESERAIEQHDSDPNVKEETVPGVSESVDPKEKTVPAVSESVASNATRPSVDKSKAVESTDPNGKQPSINKSDAVDNDKEFLKKSKLLRRLSGWKASHATLHDESGTSEPAYTHAKDTHAPETPKDTNGKTESQQTSPTRKRRWNPFRKHHHRHQGDVAQPAVPVV